MFTCFGIEIIRNQPLILTDNTKFGDFHFWPTSTETTNSKTAHVYQVCCDVGDSVRFIFSSMRRFFILPVAEVPRDLDIVPLPPGPFYIKIELFFYLAIFQCILNKIRLHLYQRWLSNAERQSIVSLLDVKC